MREIKELLMGSELLEDGFDYDVDDKPIHPYLEYLVVTDHDNQKIDVIEQREYTTRFIYSFVKLTKAMGGIQEIIQPDFYPQVEQLINDFVKLEDYENAIYLRDELRNARAVTVVKKNKT